MDENLIGLLEQHELEAIEDAVKLTSEEMSRAMRLTQTNICAEHQWQLYLNQLALFGFKRWLESRANDVAYEERQYSFSPALIDFMPGNIYLIGNQFKLCLIAVDGQPDDVVNIPRAVVDLPEFTSQFYILSSIYEEQAQVIIHSFLRYDQLADYLPTLQPNADWTYSIPIAAFNTDINRLLLYLRCLEPVAIPLPVPVQQQVTLAETQDELLYSLKRLLTNGSASSPEKRPWWQIVDWKIGATVLKTPSLMQWLEGAQDITQFAEQTKQQKHLADLLQLLTQPLMNLASWLQGQIDETTRQISWIFLPPLTGAALRLGLVSANKSSTDGSEAILTQLQRRGLELPAGGRCAYCHLTVGTIPVRLYMVVGVTRDGERSPGWSVLIILRAQHQSRLPDGTGLRLSDAKAILVEHSLSQKNGDDYLFAQIEGSWNETFLLTITEPEGASLTLPPFGFQQENWSSQDDDQC